MAGLPKRMRDAVRTRIAREENEVDALRDRARRRARSAIEAATIDLYHVRARVRALSPQSTLDRGYAVVQRADGRVVRDPDEAAGRLRVRVARGEFEAERRG
jgi:exodeoxyribonuclease VII large subunit